MCATSAPRGEEKSYYTTEEQVWGRGHQGEGDDSKITVKVAVPGTGWTKIKEGVGQNLTVGGGGGGGGELAWEGVWCYMKGRNQGIREGGEVEDWGSNEQDRRN